MDEPFYIWLSCVHYLQLEMLQMKQIPSPFTGEKDFWGVLQTAYVLSPISW